MCGISCYLAEQPTITIRIGFGFSIYFVIVVKIISLKVFFSS